MIGGDGFDSRDVLEWKKRGDNGIILKPGNTEISGRTDFTKKWRAKNVGKIDRVGLKRRMWEVFRRNWAKK